MIQMLPCLYWTDWLRADVGGGVLRLNQYLQAIPLLPGHAAVPDIALITDPFRPGDVASDRCARWEDPAKYPALYTVVDGPVPAEGEVGTIFRDAQVSIASRYIVRKSDYARSQVHAAYTMKALERCAKDFLAETAIARAARGDGHASGIYVIHADPAKGGIEYGPWHEEVGDAVAAAAFTLLLTVRDTNP